MGSSSTAPIGQVEASPTWLVDFWGAKLSESDRRSLLAEHIAVLSPAIAALSRGTGEPLNPRHQSAWVEAGTQADALSTVVDALSRIGGYAVIAVTRAAASIPLG